MFEPGPFSPSKRVLSFFYKSAVFSTIGMMAGLFGTSVSNGGQLASCNVITCYRYNVVPHDLCMYSLRVVFKCLCENAGVRAGSASIRTIAARFQHRDPPAGGGRPAVHHSSAQTKIPSFKQRRSPLVPRQACWPCARAWTPSSSCRTSRRTWCSTPSPGPCTWASPPTCATRHVLHANSHGLLLPPCHTC